VNQPDVINQASDAFSQLQQGGGGSTERHVQGRVESWLQRTGNNLTGRNSVGQVPDRGRYEEADERAVANRKSDDTSIRGLDRESGGPLDSFPQGHVSSSKEPSVPDCLSEMEFSSSIKTTGPEKEEQWDSRM
jgi:hypothetical protein